MRLWLVFAAIIIGVNSAVIKTSNVEVEIPQNIQEVLNKIRQDVEKDPEILKTVLSNEETLPLFQNPSLSYSQLVYILHSLIHLVPKGQDIWNISLPTNLLTVYPSNEILDMSKSQSDDELRLKLASRITHMLPSQQHALLLSFILDSQTGNIAAENMNNLLDSFRNSPRSVAILMNYLGPKSFKKILPRFISFFNRISDEKIKYQVISYLPWSLRRVWLEETGFTDLLSPGLTAFICSDLNDLEYNDIVDILSNINEQRKSLPSTPFPYSLMTCLRNKIIKHLESKIDPNNNKTSEMSLLDHLDNKDIYKIGGIVLGSFNGSMINEMNDTNKARLILREVGYLSVMDLITSFSKEKVRELAELAFIKSGKEDKLEEINYDDINKMGSLLFYTDGVVSELKPELIIDYLHNFTFGGEFKKIGCMGPEERKEWSTALIKAFGNPNVWEVSSLLYSGDLLITLNSDQLESISLASLYYAYPIIGEELNFNRHLQSAPYFSNQTSYINVCQKWLNDEDIMEPYKKLMRFLIKVSQFRINAKEADNKTQSENNDSKTNDQTVSRKRRQVIEPSDPFDNDARYGLKIDNVLSKWNSLPTQTLKINLAMERMKVLIRTDILRILKLDSLPDRSMTVSKVLKNFDSKDEDARKANAAAGKLFLQAQKRANVEVVEHIGATHVHFNETQEQFCQYFNDICNSPYYSYMVLSFNSSDVAKDEQDISPSSISSVSELPNHFTCKGLSKAAMSISVLTEEDFHDWTTAELEQCLELIGSIRWPLEIKKNIFDLLKSKKIVQLSQSPIPYRRMIVLNQLLEPLFYDNLNATTLSAALGPEPMSIVGSFNFEKQILSDLAEKVRVDTKAPMPTNHSLLDVKMFGAMNQIICGFEENKVKELLENSDSAEFLLPIFGRMSSCPNHKILEIMADAAISIYGEPSKWQASVISDLGIVVAGLNPQKLSQLGTCCVETISQNAASHMNVDQLKAFTEEQISVLSPSVLSSLILIDLEGEKLSEETMNVLNKTIASVEDPIFYNNVKNTGLFVNVGSEKPDEKPSTSDNEDKDSESETGVPGSSIRSQNMPILTLLMVFLFFYLF